eukprot:Nk52_evm33s1401 gene=Nk52_evmTU33s1401
MRIASDSRIARYSLAIGMKLALDGQPGCEVTQRLGVFEVLVKYLLEYRLKLMGPLEEIVEVLRLCETSIAKGKPDKDINYLIKQAHYESGSVSAEDISNLIDAKLADILERKKGSQG